MEQIHDYFQQHTSGPDAEFDTIGTGIVQLFLQAVVQKSGLSLHVKECTSLKR